MRPFVRLAAALAASLVCTLGTGAGAQEPPAPSGSPLPVPAERSVSTHHSITVHGAEIDYTATAGTLLVRDANEAPIGSFFYVAYTKDRENRNTRPLTFLYNGGPGSSSMWLHMGSLGPKHVITPDGEITGPAPYQLVDNPETLLDRSDLVFIDAMGTGYSRLAGKGTGKMFWGIDEDGAAFTKFVRRYITVNDRWNSPKFLFGESYGTTRSAVLAADLDDAGISLSGVTLLSTVLDFNTLSPSLGEDLSYIGFLPTQAAVAWYHNKIPNKPPLATFVASAKQFAAGPYAQALMRGDTLSDAERHDIAAKLSSFIGIDQAYILNADLRVTPDRFEKELLRSEHRTVGRLDGRFEGYDTDSAGETPEYDPTNSVITDAFTGAFNRYIRDDLKYVAETDYLPTNYGVVNAGWNFKRSGTDATTPATVVDDLRRAMTRNPHLRLFSANGYYDLATPFFATDYTLAHLSVPPAIAAHISYGYYESGHMVYLHPAALAALHHDLEGFYDKALAR